jgi:hypothetical protein
MTAGQTAIKAMGTALDALKAKQIALNAAVLANPYVAVAALIVGAIAAIAVAFKMIYDRSKVLRDAVSDVVNIFKEVVGTIIGEVVGAFQSLFGQQKKVGSGFSGFGDIMQKVADVVGPILAGAFQMLGTYIKVAGNVIRVIIKAFEVFFTIVKMVANIIRGVFIIAVQKITSVLSSLMDRLGPVGEAVKRVGKSIGDAFSNIPALIRGAIQSAVGLVEGLINKAIDAINVLIRAYNSIPFVDDVSEIGAFAFSGFTAGANAAAQSSIELGNAASAARYEAMAGVKDWSAYTNALNGTKQGTDTATDGLDKTGGAASKTDKVLERLKKRVEDLKTALTSASEAVKTIGDMTEQKFGEESAIQKAFGTEGDISSAISAYDQLDGALTQYYDSLMKAPGISKKITNQLRAERDQQRQALAGAAQEQINLYRARAKVQKDLETLERTYAATTAGINARFDALDKAADDAIKSIESKWAGIIPTLEAALKKATEAYERENKVLEDLVGQRKSFLDSIASSFRGFVNQLSFGEGAGGADIRAQLEDRLQAVREFAANIRTLVSRGLDPTLVREFVSAGVSGAGQAAAALAVAGESEIAAINDVQAGLATEIAAFGQYGAEQWYNAGIAQQEAIVAPLRIAAEQAQVALDTANATREMELAAARAHAEQLKIDRQAALEQARLDYEKQKADLILQTDQINAEIQANADELQQKFTGLSTTMPPQMMKIGRQSANAILRGFRARYPKLHEELNSMMTALANSMRRETTITVTTVHRSVFEGTTPPGRAMGGPVQARQAYIVGERGPELFVSNQAGNIIPNHALSTSTSFGGRTPAPTGGDVVIESGAVQVNITGSMDSMSAADIETIVDDALLRLAREIRRS